MYEYEISDLDFIYENIIYERVTNLLTPVDNPVAYILGGQPGAGKSTLQRFILKKDTNVAIINADEFRVYHPHYDEIQEEQGEKSADYTQPFINQITERLIDDLSKEKYNLIIEGTLRSAKVPMTTCEILKNRGYRVELHIICVKPEISYHSTILRYENSLKLGEWARATTKSNHDRVVENICANVDYIYSSGRFDIIKLFNRYHKIDFFNNPSEEMRRILFSDYSEIELKELYDIVKENVNLKKARQSTDFEEYKKSSVKTLKDCSDRCYHYIETSRDEYEKIKDYTDSLKIDSVQRDDYVFLKVKVCNVNRVMNKLGRIRNRNILE